MKYDEQNPNDRWPQEAPDRSSVLEYWNKFKQKRDFAELKDSKICRILADEAGVTYETAANILLADPPDRKPRTSSINSLLQTIITQLNTTTIKPGEEIEIAHQAVKGMAILERFIKYPLKKNEVICTYIPEPPELFPELEEYWEGDGKIYWNDCLAKAEGANKKLTNNQGYSLRQCIINKIQDPSKGMERVRKPTLKFEQAEYKHHVLVGSRINTPQLIRDNHQKISIKELIEKKIGKNKFPPTNWTSVADMKVPQRFATSTALVLLKENAIILGTRDRQAFEQGNARQSRSSIATCSVTMATAEGMLRPQDQENPSSPYSPPSPFNTSKRSLSEELGLVADKDYDPDTIKMLGLSYDYERCQPLAAFCIFLPDLSFDGLRQKWETAPDKEHEELIAIEMEPDQYEKLIKGEYIWNKKRLTFMSNHQMTVACLLAEHMWSTTFAPHHYQ